MKKFIYGLLFGLVAIPILDELVTVVCGYLEIPKAYSTKKILNENKIIQDLQVQQEEISTMAVGFKIPSIEEEYDDDFEDKKAKRR